MITIVDDNCKIEGSCIYSVMLGQQLICKFEHNMFDTLANCLQKAADAVEISEWADFVIMDDAKGG